MGLLHPSQRYGGQQRSGSVVFPFRLLTEVESMKNVWTLIICGVLSVAAVGCGPDTSVTTPETTTAPPPDDGAGNAGQAEQSQTATIPAGQ